MTATRTNHAATTNDGLVVHDITLGQSRRHTESPVGRDEFTAWLTASCRRQGVPVTITDPTLLAAIATLLR